MSSTRPNELLTAPQIRSAVPNDLPDIVRIERETFSKPWSARSFRELLDVPSAMVLVLTHGESPALGYAVAYVAADVGELANLAIAHEVRGKGFGRVLLAAVLRLSRARGATSLFLDVRASNVAALALYSSADFVEVGRRKDYYTHPVEDAIVMRRSHP